MSNEIQITENDIDLYATISYNQDSEHIISCTLNNSSSSATFNHDSIYLFTSGSSDQLTGAVVSNWEDIPDRIMFGENYVDANFDLDSRYYTESEIDNKLSLKLNISDIQSIEQIIDAFTISYDSDGNITDIQANAGLSSISYISALGTGDDDDSSVGLDLSTMWEALTGSTSSNIINASHIPTLSISKISDLQESLDAKLNTSSISAWALSSTKPSYYISEIGGFDEAVEPYDRLVDAFTITYNSDGSIADIQANAGLSSISYISALGTGDSDTGGSGLDLTTMWTALEGNSSYQINSSHLTTALSGYVTSSTLTSTLGSYLLSTTAASTYAQKYGSSDVSFAANILTANSASIDNQSVTSTKIALWDKISALFDVDDDGNVYVADNKGFYSNSFISALGTGDGDSGGTSDLDLPAMWAALYDSTTEQIDESHLSDALSSYVTSSSLTNTLSSYATTTYVDGKITNLIGTAPENLDTLQEIAAALSDSDDTVAGIITTLATKLDTSTAASTYATITSLTTGLAAKLNTTTATSTYATLTSLATSNSNISTLQGYFTSGVANSATKLATSRTIWGQSFNGTANIAGALTGVTTITASSTITANSASINGQSVTSTKIALWDKISALFDVDDDGNVYVKDDKGLYSNSFISALGTSDSSGTGSSGLDLSTMWEALTGSSLDRVIKEEYIPDLEISKITNLQSSLDAKLNTSSISAWALSTTKPSYSYTEITGLTTALSSYLTTSSAASTYATISNLTATNSNITTLQGYFTSGVANSATKLSTSRTIWGQYFNGTANVTGAMSGVTSISMSGALSGVTTISTTGDIATTGGIVLPYTGGYWSSMYTSTNLLRTSIATSTSPHSLFRVTGSTGSMLTFGGVGAAIGFYGFYSSLIDAGTNYFSYQTYWNTDTGTLYHSKDLTVSGIVTAASASINSQTITSTKIALWDKISALFNTDSDGNVYVTNNKGFYSNSFVSALGTSDGDTGTASSAVKLATERTIWGQYFDGTANVTGSLTGVSTISATGDITTTGGIVLPYTGGAWNTMYTNTNVLRTSISNSSSSAHTLFRVTGSTGSALAFGGLGSYIGFYGFYSSTISSNTNTSNFSTRWDTDTGTLYHSLNFVAGGTITGSNITSSSDMRMKENITPINSAKEFIGAMDIFSHTWKEHEGKTIGISAQWLQETPYSYLVHNVNDRLSVDYKGLQMLALVGLKETNSEVDKLKEKIKQLKLEIKQLNDKLWQQ